MAKVGAQRAAELTGKSKSTIQRAMNNGKVSFELDSNGRRVVDVSELERAFGLEQQAASKDAPQQNNDVEIELERAKTMLEMERLKMQIKILEDKLEMAETQIDDLKGQRDKWQKQADQVLITSQHSQKQADELREQIRQRDEHARMAKEQRRQKQLEERMKRLKAENDDVSDNFSFQSLWKKVKGA